METIYFKNEEEFDSVTIYYSGGFESKLYRFMSNDRELLLKKYYDQVQIKISKIEKVSQLKTEGLLKPELMINIGGVIKGFSMEFARGFYPLAVEKKDLSDIQKYSIIIKLKQILTSLRQEGCSKY